MSNCRVQQLADRNQLNAKKKIFFFFTVVTHEWEKLRYEKEYKSLKIEKKCVKRAGQNKKERKC